MVNKPPLPDDYDLPGVVNGWTPDPGSNRNGHVWTAAEHDVSVAVFAHVGAVRVAVFDDRVTGFGSKVEPYDDEAPDDRDALAGAVVDGIKHAVAWMRDHRPGEWSHPDVNEAVFDAPEGYVLDRYYLEQRDAEIYYRLEDAESKVEGFDTRDPQRDPYLYVQTWLGSGNSTVATAPWLHAHDHELTKVVDPPAECGLDIALRYAREHVGDSTGVTSGQTGLAQFDGGGQP